RPRRQLSCRCSAGRGCSCRRRQAGDTRFGGIPHRGDFQGDIRDEGEAARQIGGCDVTTGFPTSRRDRVDRSGWRKWLGPGRAGLLAFALLVVCTFPSGARSANGQGNGQKAPTMTALPTISGTAAVGKILTASTGSWSGNVSS